MNLIFRKAVIEDAAPMMRVHREAVLAKAGAHYSRKVLEEWAKGPIPERVHRVEQEINNPDFVVFIAEADGEVVGFSMAVPSTHELRAVYVKPNAVGGIGRRLLAKVEEEAFRMTDFLACDASLNAEGFYKSTGYSVEAYAEHTLNSGITMPCVKMKKAKPSGIIRQNEGSLRPEKA